MSGPQTLPRRAALMAVAGTVGHLYGRPVTTQGGRGILLALDDTGPIILHYRGRRIIVQPQELMDALSPSRKEE